MRTIHVARRAQKQIAAAARWWERNRNKAPDAFADDLAHAYELIAETPLIGVHVRSRRGGLRKVLLPRARYYLYYREGPGIVEVTALWHASRRPPRL